MLYAVVTLSPCPPASGWSASANPEGSHSQGRACSHRGTLPCAGSCPLSISPESAGQRRVKGSLRPQIHFPSWSQCKPTERFTHGLWKHVGNHNTHHPARESDWWHINLLYKAVKPKPHLGAASHKHRKQRTLMGV